MTISYTDQATIVADPTWRARVTQAAAVAASAILGEAIGGMSATETEKRQTLAQRVLNSDGAVLHGLTGAVLANVGTTASTATIESEILDSEIDTALSSVWNDVAGVRTDD